MYSRLLVHRATIWRRTAGETRFGQPADTYRTLATDVPCRITRASGQTIRSDRLQGTVTADHVVYFEPTVDVNEDDIVRVSDTAGHVIADDLQIVIVRRVSTGAGGKHHVEVPCRTVRGMVGVE